MRILTSPAVRIALVTTVVLATFAVFGWYIYTHPEVINTLTHIGPGALILLTMAYAITIVANGFILHHSLEYVQRKTPMLDNVLLTGYSAIVNFFGPLQSGPGFRAVYLKKKYGIEVRKFIGATVLFYVFFALINAAVIGVAVGLQYPLVLAALIAVLAVLALLFPKFKPLLLKIRLLNVLLTSEYHPNKSFWLIGASTGLLIAGSTIAYAVELNLVHAGVGWWSVLVYSATANLALFVALTPGAIGFREAFLLMSQQLHHIDAATIAAANIIDRAFYVVFLLVMFAILLAINYRKHLDIFSTENKASAKESR
jgi:uncharacterized membrane protein YbhN (UPF0104 family)